MKAAQLLAIQLRKTWEAYTIALQRFDEATTKKDKDILNDTAEQLGYAYDMLEDLLLDASDVPEVVRPALLALEKANVGLKKAVEERDTSTALAFQKLVVLRRNQLSTKIQEIYPKELSPGG